MNTRRRVLAVIAALLAGGCATIIHGSMASVTLDSSPVGVQALVDGRAVRTPAVIDLKRDKTHTIIFSAPGYTDQSATIEPRVSGWVFGNIVFGPLFGLVGVLVDLNNGAMYAPSDDVIMANLALAPVRFGARREPEPPEPATCWQLQDNELQRKKCP